MTGDRVTPPICSSCGYWYVGAANDPICIECGHIQRTLVAWCLMRAAEIGATVWPQKLKQRRMEQMAGAWSEAAEARNKDYFT